MTFHTPATTPSKKNTIRNAGLVLSKRSSAQPMPTPTMTAEMNSLPARMPSDIPRIALGGVGFLGLRRACGRLALTRFRERGFQPVEAFVVVIGHVALAVALSLPAWSRPLRPGSGRGNSNSSRPPASKPLLNACVRGWNRGAPAGAPRPGRFGHDATLSALALLVLGDRCAPLHARISGRRSVGGRRLLDRDC